MQLTAETLNTLFASFYERQLVAVRSVNIGRIGVMPGYANRVRGVFVRDTIEVEIHDLMAVLPSGIIANIDETAVVKVPLLYGDTYYFTVGVSDALVSFESNGVPFVRNEYSFAISSFDEMVAASAFPLIRFSVKDGVFSIDDQYIMPCLATDGDSRIAGCVGEMADRLRTLAGHPNIADEALRTSLLGFAFRLDGFCTGARRVADLVLTTREVASAIDYFIVRPNNQDAEAPMEPSFFDIDRWFVWLKDYIDSATAILDGVVVEKEKIDLEAIKQELRAEIYDHIQPDLERMVNERVDNLSDALQSRIEDVLKDYVNGKVLVELRDSLRLQLDADLRSSLYADLYQALYAVLFVPKEDEDAFVPLI